MGHAAMGQLMGDGGDDAGLAIGEFGRGDAGLLAQLGAGPVGGDEKTGADSPPVLEAGRDMSRPALDLADAAGGYDHDIGQRGQPGGERPADRPILHDMAEGRAEAGVEMIVMQEQRCRGPARPAVGDADIEDGLGRGRHAGPDPELGEGLLRGEGDGRGAAVIAGRLALRRRLGIHRQHLQPGPAEGDGRGHADHAAADDEHIRLDVGLLGIAVPDIAVGGL